MKPLRAPMNMAARPRPDRPATHPVDGAQPSRAAPLSELDQHRLWQANKRLDERAGKFDGVSLRQALAHLRHEPDLQHPSPPDLHHPEMQKVLIRVLQACCDMADLSLDDSLETMKQVPFLPDDQRLQDRLDQFAKFVLHKACEPAVPGTRQAKQAYEAVQSVTWMHAGVGEERKLALESYLVNFLQAATAPGGPISAMRKRDDMLLVSACKTALDLVSDARTRDALRMELMASVYFQMESAPDSCGQERHINQMVDQMVAAAYTTTDAQVIEAAARQLTALAERFSPKVKNLGTAPSRFHILQAATALCESVPRMRPAIPGLVEQLGGCTGMSSQLLIKSMADILDTALRHPEPQRDAATLGHLIAAADEARLKPGKDDHLLHRIAIQSFHIAPDASTTLQVGGQVIAYPKWLLALRAALLEYWQQTAQPDVEKAAVAGQSILADHDAARLNAEHGGRETINAICPASCQSSKRGRSRWRIGLG